MTNPLITKFQKPLRDICRRFGVEQLYLFGSAIDGRFQPGRSDLDFIVTFPEQPPGEYAESFLGLAQALENLFQTRIDLLTERSIRNPYFRKIVLTTRQLIYDRRDEKAVA